MFFWLSGSLKNFTGIRSTSPNPTRLAPPRPWGYTGAISRATALGGDLSAVQLSGCLGGTLSEPFSKREVITSHKHRYVPTRNYTRHKLGVGFPEPLSLSNEISHAFAWPLALQRACKRFSSRKAGQSKPNLSTLEHNGQAIL